jgi:hypothetical protein
VAPADPDSEAGDGVEDEPGPAVSDVPIRVGPSESGTPPRAPASASVEPSRVDFDALRRGPPPDQPGAPPVRRAAFRLPDPLRKPSTWIIALGALCIASFLIDQIPGSGSTNSSPGSAQQPASTPPVTSPPPATTPTSPPTTPTAPPGQGQAATLWSRPVRLSYNQDYGLDSFPPARDVVHGFSIAPFPGGGISLTPEQAGNIARWSGGKAPSAGACQDLVASSGTDHVELGGGGVSVGGWICALTQQGNTVRLRYGGGSVDSGYSFDVTVWGPG